VGGIATFFSLATYRQLYIEINKIGVNIMSEHTAHNHGLETRGLTLGHHAHQYDHATGLFGLGRSFRQRTVELAGIKPGDKVLDVGCGTGTLALIAKEAAGPDGDVHGIDAAPEMIEVANRNAQKAGLAVNFQPALIEDLPFAGDEFDVVLSSFMIHHLPDDLKQQGFAELYRVLKPGGKLLVVDFGKPTNLIARMVAAVFNASGEYIASNIKGMLPVMIQEASFQQVELVGKMLGLISFVQGVKTAR
jgi:ubiquinone/menaquinone biosynthesis C-methylase UbiE